MKKLIIVAGTLLLSTTIAFAHIVKTGGTKMSPDKINPDKVSVLTKYQFASDFPGAKNVRFMNNGNFDEVSFREGKQAITAYYDFEGHLQFTVGKDRLTDLPKMAQNRILKNYPGYTVAGVVEFNGNEDQNPELGLRGQGFDDENRYFVELKKQGKAIVVAVDPSGDVSYFATAQ